MEHRIQLGHQSVPLTLLPPSWSIIGLVNIHISQFISLLYMYIWNAMEYTAFWSQDMWETPKDYQRLPKHPDTFWHVPGLMWEILHCYVYPGLARIKVRFPDAVHEKELLAVIWALKKCKPILFSTHSCHLCRQGVPYFTPQGLSRGQVDKITTLSKAQSVHINDTGQTGSLTDNWLSLTSDTFAKHCSALLTTTWAILALTRSIKLSKTHTTGPACKGI
jgi:hypothetical protein